MVIDLGLQLPRNDSGFESGHYKMTEKQNRV